MAIRPFLASTELKNFNEILKFVYHILENFLCIFGIFSFLRIRTFLKLLMAKFGHAVA